MALNKRIKIQDNYNSSSMRIYCSRKVAVGADDARQPSERTSMSLLRRHIHTTTLYKPQLPTTTSSHHHTSPMRHVPARISWVIPKLIIAPRCLSRTMATARRSYNVSRAASEKAPSYPEDMTD
jgi:hypothetical protein